MYNKRYVRIPVVYKKQKLMPMTLRRARLYAKLGKGKFHRSKNLGLFFELKVEPTGFDTQDITLGIDPGTRFNGFSVVSDKCHNANFQRNTFNKEQVQKRIAERKSHRRERRSRIRHRKSRFDSRNGSKISATSNYYYQVKVQMVKDILKLYPINTIVIEDVSFNHFVNKNGSSFSNIEIGKNRFSRAIKDLGVKLVELKGKDTKNLRAIYLKKDKKCKDKSTKSFYAHCFDSFVLANSTFDNKKFINQSFNLIEEKPRSSRSGRRKLVTRSTSNKDPRIKSYFRYNRCGLLKPVIHKSKLRKIRFKINSSKSNHGPWKYLYLPRTNTIHTFTRIRCDGYIKDNKYKKYSGKNKKVERSISVGRNFYNNYLSNKIINAGLIINN